MGRGEWSESEERSRGEEREKREGVEGKSTALSCSAALGWWIGSVSEQRGAGVWLLLSAADVIV